ncbi:MAG: hypothetical protein ACLS9H_03275 [Dialister sp.]
MVRNEEVENIKEKMTKYIEFYKSVLTNLEKINDKVMGFDKKVYNKRFREFFENNHTEDKKGNVYLIEWVSSENWGELIEAGMEDDICDWQVPYSIRLIERAEEE